MRDGNERLLDMLEAIVALLSATTDTEDTG